MDIVHVLPLDASKEFLYTHHYKVKTRRSKHYHEVLSALFLTGTARWRKRPLAHPKQCIARKEFSKNDMA